MPTPNAHANSVREKILVRGVNWLGDAVMSTPALQRLREAKPDAEITLLTHEKLADLWKFHCSIDAVETFSSTESVWQIGGRLRQKQFDVALVLPNSPRSALEVWLARIPKRVGYARSWRNWFLTQTVAERTGAVKMHKRSVAEIQKLIQSPAPPKTVLPPEAHHIYQYLHLIKAIGGNGAPLPPQLFATDAEVAAASQKFGLASTPAETLWLGLNAGAEYGPAKRWPKERFIATAIVVQKETNCRWIIFGGKADAVLAGEIATEIQRAAKEPKTVCSVAGKTSLRELCALLKKCRVLLTNDTGPMHVAAALGTSVVVPFGSTSPELTGPNMPKTENSALIKADVACSPCFLRECPIDFRCMKSIDSQRVASEILHILKPF